MKRLFVSCLLLSTLAASAEPGVAVILDSRQPGQADSAARARRFCYVLIKQNQLADYQFSLKTVDLATSEGRQFARDFQLTGRDLPALGYYQREGNRIRLKNLVRHYRDPQQAAQDAFRCAQADNPELVPSIEVITGARVTSEPSGAVVKEGDTELGLTPCQVELGPGRHELTVADPDCAPEKRTLNLKAGDNPQVDLALVRYPSQVTLESSGEPLELYLDEQPVGTTPLTLQTTAGKHNLRAVGKDAFPIETVLDAEPNSRMLARVKPTPVRVMVGWAGLEAEGYTYSYTSYYYPVSYYRGRRCNSWAYSTAIPYEVTSSVDLSSYDLTRKAQGLVLSRPDLALLEVDQGWDCGLKLQVQADQYQVVGELAVLDAKGERIQTFKAQRDMPWLTFDSEGSARKRADQVVNELVDQGLAWIHDNVEPGGLTEEEQAGAVEVTQEGPLSP